VKVELTYNPYFVTTIIKINGKEKNYLDEIVNKRRLQDWIDTLIPLILERENQREMDLIFTGTNLDADDVRNAIEELDGGSDHISVSYIESSKGVEDRITDLKKLFEDAKDGPITEFQTKEMAEKFQRALDPNFEINVIATMSAGKSTVINAMLGKELMPAKNEACTATVAKIYDHDDMKEFEARRFDINNVEIDGWRSADNDLLCKWNADDKNTSIIELRGDIPTVTEHENVRIVLVDTPGPNNSRNEDHAKVTESTISSKPLSMVLYVLNATQLSTDDDKGLLDSVSKAMKAGGRNAQDRFIFIANKIDNFDPEKGESVGRALNNIRKYLQDNGIENPLVIPASAELAKLVRMERFGEKLTRSQRNSSRNYVELFVEEDEMNMLSHVKGHINKASYQLLEERLDRFSSDEDKAEIRSGIPIVEELFNNFLQKHALPSKVKDAVDIFSHVMAQSRGIEKLNELLNEGEEGRKSAAASLKSFKNNGNRLKKATEFREKIKVMKYKPSKEEKEAKVMMTTENETFLSELALDFDGNVSPRKAKGIFERAKQESTRHMNRMDEDLKSRLKKEYFGVLESYISEYDKYVRDVVEQEFKGNPGLIEFQKTTMAMPDTKAIILDSTNEERYEKHVGTERSWTSLWLVEKDVYETRTRDVVDMKRTWGELETILRSAFVANYKKFATLATEQTELAKEDFLLKMDAIDKKVDENIESMRKAALDKKEAERMIMENQEKISWFDSFNSDLQRVLAL